MRGMLDDAQSRHVLDHLDQCETCSIAADTVGVAGDPLLKHLPAVDESATIDPDRTSGLIALLVKLPEKRKSVVIPGYTFLNKIGRGGMGDVWKAKSETTGEVVAIKLIASSLLASAEVEKRFEREAKALRNLECDHVAGFREFGSHQGCAYLAMEWVDGMNLSELIRVDGPLHFAMAAKMVRDVCSGLAVVHSAGLIHRDIKPANILILRDSSIRIVDFGLVREVADDGSQQTKAGQVLGTFDYIAPEQLDGKIEVTAAADIYATGCTLFELISGTAPLADKLTQWEKGNAHLAGTIPDVRTVRPEAPGILATLIREMTYRDASQRPTAAQAATRLGEILHGHNLSASHASRLLPVSLPSPVASAIAVGILCLLGVLASSIILSPKNSPGSKPTMHLDANWSPDVTRKPLPGWVPYPAKLSQFSRWQVYPSIPQSSIAAIAWSHTGRRLGITTYDGLTRVYDASGKSVKLLHILPDTKRMVSDASLAFGHDDRFLATTNQLSKAVNVWDIGHAGEHRCRLAAALSFPDVADQRATSIAWHPTHSRLAIGTGGVEDGNARGGLGVWEFDANGNPQNVFRQSPASSTAIQQVQWAASGDFLVSIGNARLLHVWPIEGRMAPRVHELDSTATALAINARDNQIVVADASGRLSLLSEDLQQVASVQTTEKNVRHLICRGDGRVLAGGKQLWSWNPGSASEPVSKLLGGSSLNPGGFSLNLQDQRIAVADPLVDVQIYYDDGSQPTKLFDQGDMRLHALDAHPTDSSKWAIGLGDGTVKLWDSTSNQTRTVATHKHSIGAVSFSPDGTRIASSDYWHGSGILVSSLDESSPNQRWFYQHKKEIPSLTWSPDSVWLASASHDGTVQVINTRSPQQLILPPLHQGESQMKTVAFRRDGRRLAFAGDDARVYVNNGPEAAFSRRFEFQVPGRVNSLAWGPDESLVVAIEATDELMVVNAETGNVICKSKASHRNYKVQWSPDDRFIFSGTYGLLQTDTLKPSATGFGKYGVFSHDGSTALVAGQYAPAMLLDLGAMQPQRVWSPLKQSAVSFSTAGLPIAGTPPHVLDELHCLVERDDGSLQLMAARDFYRRYASSTK